jgi:hypothetical protein
MYVRCAARTLPRGKTHEDDTLDAQNYAAGAAALTLNFGFGPGVVPTRFALKRWRRVAP